MSVCFECQIEWMQCLRGVLREMVLFAVDDKWWSKRRPSHSACDSVYLVWCVLPTKHWAECVGVLIFKKISLSATCLCGIFDYCIWAYCLWFSSIKIPFVIFQVPFEQRVENQYVRFHTTRTSNLNQSIDKCLWFSVNENENHSNLIEIRPGLKNTFHLSLIDFVQFHSSGHRVGSNARAEPMPTHLIQRRKCAGKTTNWNQMRPDVVIVDDWSREWLSIHYLNRRQHYLSIILSDIIATNFH